MIRRLGVMGLRGSGKTCFLLSLLSLGKRYQVKLGACKPLDTGLMAKNARDEFHDGEFFCAAMEGQPHVSLVSTYISSREGPLDLAFSSEGIRVNWSLLEDRLRILLDNYDAVLIEVSAGFLLPVNSEGSYLDWLKENVETAFWIVQPDIERFDHNLSQLLHLKNSNLPVRILLNNAGKSRDSESIQYCWNKLEELSGFPVEGMIPYDENLPGRISSKLQDKLKTNFESLFHEIFLN